jgi:hypothetical protein
MRSVILAPVAKIARHLTLAALSVMLAYVAAPSQAHEAPIRIVVVGEDSDSNTVARTNEIYKRVVSELQESLIKEQVTVIDEDLMAVKLGFSFESRRDKQELLQALITANQTTDATVQSRLGMIFAVFPNIHELDFTRKITVRVRAQIYDLKTLSALSSFEVESPDAVTVPKKDSMCNRLCVEEAVGEVAVGLARELGAILHKKLDILIQDGKYLGNLAGTAAASTAAGDSTLQSVYTVKFISMRSTDVMQAVNALEKSHVQEIELLKSEETERDYSVRTNKNLGDLESIIMNILLANGVDTSRLRFTSFGTQITIEAL